MRNRTVAILSLSVMLLQSCAQDHKEVFELSGSTMGTRFSIKLPQLPPAVDAEVLRQDIDNELLQIEMQMSTYRVDSAISRFNVSDSVGWQSVPIELCKAIEESLEISERTAGAFDITIGPLVNLWGFGPDGSVRTPPSEQDIAAAQQRVGYSRLQADCTMPAIRKEIPRLYLDLSAYAKGYAVDRLGSLLDAAGATDYLVEIGGEMKLRGRNAERQEWAVAIEAPLQNERRVQRVFRLTNQSVATSGDYRNFFESGGVHFSHTIDSRSGKPVGHNLASVTVIAETTAIADAMATALLVLGPDDGLTLATKENIAAFLLIRGSQGIEERMSPAFAGIGVEP